jgi:Zn-dependent peptidase ImmA (M78 family)
MLRVDIKPQLFRWACERSGKHPDELTEHFPHLADWMAQRTKPTLKQVEDFAHATHTSIGFFFLPEPPVEKLPISDYRTVGSVIMGNPSPDLLDTLYQCQQQQEWYRNYALSSGEKQLAFVGSATTASSTEAIAQQIRQILGLDASEPAKHPTWESALRHYISKAEDAGILVMINGIVGTNTHRKLDPEEFRGFALSDPIAPLIFINNVDTKSAQIFTFAHEIAHLWLGESALSDMTLNAAPSQSVERWCNQVAAEVLVPMKSLRSVFQPDAPLAEEVLRLARRFKVSTLVMLRRIFDSGAISRATFDAAYGAELQRLRNIPKKEDGGGNFYLSHMLRTGKRFASALISSTLEGYTTYTESFQLLGVKKTSTFNALRQNLGVL